MKLVTRHTLAASALGRWERQYPIPDARIWSIGRPHTTPGDYAARLRALGPNPAPDAVDAILGNVSWTTPYCSACQQNADEVVEVINDDERTITLCPECVFAAMKAIDGEG